MDRRDFLTAAGSAATLTLTGTLGRTARAARSQATGKTLAYLEAGGAVQPLVNRIRHYLVANGTNSHHYKFAEAAIENHALSTRSPWRDRYLAAGFAYFNGPWNRTNATVRGARELLEA